MKKISKKSLEIKKTDYQFYERKLEKVVDFGDVWGLYVVGGDVLGCPKIIGFIPKSGMICKFYGKGFGYTVRGVEIDGHIMYYRTPEESEQDHLKRVAKYNKEAYERFKKNAKKNRSDYNSLPQAFKNRMDRLRNKSPHDRHQWEPYEMFILTQAAEIANHLKTVTAIERWVELKSMDEQKKLVPTLDERHSGNTYGCSVHLAKRYLSGMEL